MEPPVRQDRDAVSAGHCVLVVYGGLADGHDESRIGQGLFLVGRRSYPRDTEDSESQYQNHGDFAGAIARSRGALSPVRRCECDVWPFHEFNSFEAAKLSTHWQPAG